jgi:hypothetical protein
MSVVMSLYTDISGWLSKNRRYIGIITVGHTAKQIEEYVFDWLLYGFVVSWATLSYGPIWGALVAFLIMTPLSALVCWLYIRFYDWLKRDWLGIEVLKELKDAENTDHWFGRFFRKIARAGAIPAFIALSIYGDPFMVTVYFRHGAHTYHGLSKRDWRIFYASVLVSNAFWTLNWAVIVAVALLIWRYVFTPFFN